MHSIPFSGGCLLLGGCLLCWGGCLLRHPPLLTESQTHVKTLPWPNFVAAGNEVDLEI